MRRVLGLTCLALLLCAGLCQADTDTQKIVLIPDAGDEPVITMSEDRSDFSVITISFPTLSREDLVVDGENWQALTIPGGDIRGQSGQAGLPVFSGLIAVPEGCDVALRVRDTRQRELSGFRILPVQPDDAAEAVIDRAYYRTRAMDEVALIRSGEIGYLRGLRVMPVTVNPVAYQPTSGKLLVYETIELELEYRETGERTAVAAPTFLPESFARLYRDVLFNGDSRALAGLLDVQTGPGTYLVICPHNSSVIQELEPLLDWRRRQGYNVRLATLAETGSSSSQIKNHIQTIYDTIDPPLEHVLLVGDANGTVAVPCSYETLSGYNGEGDHYYTKLEGDDVLADIHIGRLSCRNTTELGVIVDKIVTYETDPPLTDSDWFTRATVIGDPNGSGITTIYCAQWVKAELLKVGYTEVDSIFSGNFATQMINSTSRGISVFAYRGFGNMSGLSANHIGYMSNGYKLPFAVLPTCETGSFSEESNCRSEAFLRCDGGGAVGSIGTATPGTHTRYNNCFFIGTWQGMLNGSDHRLGYALTRGKLELFINYNSIEPSKVEIWSMWNTLMGDPATNMWMDYPAALDVSYPAALPTLASGVPVTVSSEGAPVAGARVAAFKDGEVRVTALTDDSGQALLPVSGLTSGELKVTVYGHNLMPHRGALTIGGSNFLALDEIAVDDDLSGASVGNGDGVVNPGETIELRTSLRYLGLGILNSVTATLSCSDPLVTITDAEETFATINSSSPVWCDEDFDFELAATAPDGHVIQFGLTADNGLESWESTLSLVVKGSTLELVEAVWLGDGVAEPGDEGELRVEVHNLGELATGSIAARLESLDPQVTITDGLADISALAAGGSADNGADPFDLTIATYCFVGHRARLKLVLEYNDRAASELVFYLPIGERESSDPFGPDAYGYYIFDDTDTAYQQVPVYDWVEINPNLGGPGTDVGLTDFNYEQDDTRVYILPFTFKFYGIEYDKISICSNGWIAMGETSTRFYRNFNLPSSHTAPGMIAPFWDNLVQTGSHRVYRWYDEDEHRLVIEWSHMANGAGGYQTFELILLDPAHHPTNTGDGEIIFQYAEVSNYDFTNGCGTVGIQNHLRDDGLTYTYWSEYPAGAADLISGRALRIVPLDLSLQPTCDVTPGSISVVLSPGQQTRRTVRIANNGDENSILSYELLLSDPDIVGAPRQSGERGIAGSTMVANVTEFDSGTTRDVIFTVDCQTTDWDYIVGMNMDFPVGVTVNSGTPFYSPGNDFPFGGPTGDGANPVWDWGWMEGGNTAWSRLNLTFGDHLEDDVTVIYNLQGYGMSAPSIVSGLIEFTFIGESVKLLSPNGGEYWALGDEQEILFEGGGDLSSIRLELSRNGGDSWETLAEDLAVATGVYTWTVTGEASAHCLMRISDMADPSISDVSLDEFMIGESVAWITPSRYTGMLVGGFEDEVELTINASGLAGGLHEAVLLVKNNAGEIRTVTVSLSVGGTDVGETPAAMFLAQNHPNPFNPSTTISFGLPTAERARLEIYDVGGRRVRVLVDETLPAGRHEVVWSGTDAEGAPLATGLYFYSLTAGDRTLKARMLLLK
ncbi:MAG: hypothetical protein GY835_12375 [bacterium]|nr:hypothetical protein [bacterium]